MNPSDFYPVANADALKKEYVGKKLDQIPTPAFIVDRSVMDRNCDSMLQRASKMNAKFRAHVKTHKCNEGVDKQLGSGQSDRVVVSTLMEAWRMKDYYTSGKITDVLYGLPVVKSRIGELVELSKYVNIRLMIDHPCQLDLIMKYSKENGLTKPWSFFVKVNMGTNRAGMITGSEELNELIKYALKSEHKEYLSLYGFYCHAGHSYASHNSDEASGFLRQEITAANEAAKIAKSIDESLDLTISVGSTPTAHSFGLVDTKDMGLVADLELHAGNYPFCDLQQMATHCISQDNVACSVLAEVASCYNNRGETAPGEVLINAGVIALAREPGPYPGFGQVSTKGFNEWHVGRLSQEHGILTPKSEDAKFPELGQRLRIIPQHSCITANAYPWYYVVDGGDEVVDIWTAWRGW